MYKQKHNILHITDVFFHLFNNDVLVDGDADADDDDDNGYV